MSQPLFPRLSIGIHKRLGRPDDRLPLKATAPVAGQARLPMKQYDGRCRHGDFSRPLPSGHGWRAAGGARGGGTPAVTAPEGHPATMGAEKLRALLLGGHRRVTLTGVKQGTANGHCGRR